MNFDAQNTKIKFSPPAVHLAVRPPQWSVEQRPLGIAYLSGNLKAKNIPNRQVDFSVQIFAERPEHQWTILSGANWLNCIR